jgi:hypothetical protein
MVLCIVFVNGGCSFLSCLTGYLKAFYIGSEVSAEIYNPIPTPNTMPTPTAVPGVNPKKLNISTVVASSYLSPNVPKNTIDGIVGPDSRWSASGMGQWIKYDLGKTCQVNYISIAWHAGNVQSMNFEIYTSTDKKPRGRFSIFFIIILLAAVS